MPQDKDKEAQMGPRPFWSGTIAFGLVSIPVRLFTANRGAGVSLRMLDSDGTPLSRRYFCSKENIVLSHDDLVRGYEIEPGKFIEIEDEELEALVPDKSREIDLRRFVPVSDINPMYFERAYFLIPDEGALKAYRLLAYSMDNLARAGVATVVMRGKEYLVAIIAEGGILRAETLRFADELRSPEDIGLPSVEVSQSADTHLAKIIQQLSVEKLNKKQLMDEYSQKLKALVEKKLESGDDIVYEAGEEEPEPEGAEVIDLMQVLKERLEGRDSTSEDKANNGSVDESMTKKELYERAQELDIQGRSDMSKRELLEALQNNR